MVVVPTRASAAHLVRTIEDQMLDSTRRALVLPDLVTPRELTARLGERVPGVLPPLTNAEREALLGMACRAAQGAGVEPPFRLRPGLIAEILAFYDELRRRRNSVDDFERRVLAQLEPGAATDRGAERLVRQTRFLVAAFRDFERRAAAHGEDEHGLRARLIATRPPRPYRHVVLAVVDQAFDPYGLFPVDWDLLTRVPGLERIDVVVTDTTLAGALHEHIHRVLPGIEETRHEPGDPPRLPVLLIPPGGSLVHVARDREEEVADFARRVKAGVRDDTVSSPSRVALIVRQRLPYVYLAREVLQSAGVPCQLYDALPLAAEPGAAALDLVFSCVSANFARVPSVALLRSPHFRLAEARDVAALDRALAEAGYLGELAALERLLDSWRESDKSRSRLASALRAGETLLEIARALVTLRAPAPVAEHLRRVLDFLSAYEATPGPDDPLRARQLRTRGAIRATLDALGDAFARFAPAPVEGDEVAALVRRWIEGQTFAPRTGDSGVHLVDSDSARFGRFEYVHLAGVVDGEWPDHGRRNIFYSPAVLRELGWPSESDRLAGVRATFADLLRLAERRVSVSAFSLEADAFVSQSPLTDQVEQAGLDCLEEAPLDVQIFDHEALCHGSAALAPLDEHAREWAGRRLEPPALPLDRFRGFTAPYHGQPYSLGALERYQDCPFKFFAANVLRLEEPPEDESTISPRARGRFVHEVLQRFFEAWDGRGEGQVTPERFDEARLLLEQVAEPMLARLPEADATLERTRLFGSAISTGCVDVVLGHEASSSAAVRGRWLEHRFAGEFTLGVPDGPRVGLKGVADRIDLLTGNRLRVIDYKTGRAPNPARALQVPIYALCAQELLRSRGDGDWVIDEAAYLAFGGKRPHVPVVASGGAHAGEVLDAARERLLQVVDGIARGEFPPRPHDQVICDACAYAAVCRKDYVA